MTTNHNRVDPARNGTRNPLEDDRFTENSSSEYITDLSKFKMLVHHYWDGKPYSAVGALPHGLEIEFLHTSLIGCNRCTLDADFVFLDSIGSVDSNLVMGLTQRPN